MTKLWDLRDFGLPEEFNLIRKVFIGEPNDRKHNETLHDYLTRKSIICFCKKCRIEKEKRDNATLL